MNKMFLIGLLCVIFLSGCGSKKYDGMTAEEWAIDYENLENKYDSFRSCVEDYERLELQNKYKGVFYYCE